MREHGVDGVLTAREDAATHNLTWDINDILFRVANLPDIAAALSEVHLRSADLVKALGRDERIRAGAQDHYQPVAAQEQALAEHSDRRPAFWEPGWRPAAWQSLTLLGAVVVALAWPVFSLKIVSMGIFSMLVTSLAVLVALWFLVALYCLPPSVAEWQVWFADFIRLRAALPRKIWLWRSATRDEFVIPIAREWINGKKEPTYDLHFTLSNRLGIERYGTAGPLVVTSSIERVAHELMRGGSGAIGIAGWRGVGKTTIIERTLAQSRADTMAEANFLTVHASAPVRYEERDFILHLYAMTCRAIIARFDANSPLRRAGADIDSSALWRRLSRRAWLRSKFGRLLGRAAVRMLSSLLGGAVFLVGMLLSGDRLGMSLALDRAAGLVRAVVQSPLQYVESLDSLAKIVTTLGIVVFALPLIGGALTLAMSAAWALMLGVPAVVRAARHAGRNRPSPDVRALVALARHELRRIRYLQTRTEGWSGKLASSRGLGFGWDRSVQRAEQPLTQPEVVEGYRTFLSRAAEVARSAGLHSVVVAIDELDKIVDAEEAQHFVNAIKSVFGVVGCTFVVSVSEDALTSFDRRGTPVRDAFDSAFRAIIHVEPFTLEESRTWLARRVIGIPWAFVCLCHCLSGGLPRELYRVTTAMCDLATQSSGAALDDVAAELVQADLQVKKRAFMSAVRRFGPNDAADPILLHINDLPVAIDPSAGSELLRWYERMSECDANSTSAGNQFRREIAVVLYFHSTVVDFFTMSLTRDDLDRFMSLDSAEEAGTVHALTAARQQMAIDPALTGRILHEFRQAWGLPLPRSRGPAESGLAGHERV